MSTRAAPPMSRMPFWVTSRSLRKAKRVGTQRSRAMLDRTRGPSRKPAWAATNRMAASDTSTKETMIPPAAPQERVTVPRNTAFRVLPGSRAASWSMKLRIRPTTMKDRDTAM